LTLAAGFAIGASVAVLALLIWTLARPVSREALENRIMPGGYDLEVKLSEAFLNRMVGDELAQRQVDLLTSMTLDAQPDNLLVATLSGPIDLGGAASLPSLDVQLRLGILDGGLDAKIESVQAGRVQIDPSGLPEFLQPVFRSAEESVTSAVNERLRVAGLELTGVRTDEDGVTLGVLGIEAQ
jgi:hypothetical protein